MSARAAVQIAWFLWTLTLMLTALTALLSFYVPGSPERSEPGPMLLLFSLLILTFPTVGVVIVTRRSENPIGLIFCGAGLVIALQSFALTYADYALFARPGTLPGAEIMAWISSWIGMPVLALAGALLFLLFPDGRLPSRRWRFVIWMAAVGSVLVAVGMALRPGPLDTHSTINNPFGIGGAIGDVLWVVSIAGAVLLNVGGFASGVSLILRWRRAGGAERQQIKWFAYAAVLIGVGFFASLVFSGQLSSLAWFLFILGFMGLPVATGIAILRYRLYDIDLIINRTLVYGVLTVTLGLVYLGSVVLLRGLLFGFREPSEAAIVASTLLIAALFNPLRSRLQRGVNRLMYGERDEPYAVLSRLGRHLETTLTPGDALRAIVETVAQALRLPYAAIKLKQAEGFETVAEYGTLAQQHLVLPLTYGPETVGQLVLAPRTPGESFTKSDLRLLEDLARQVGVAAHAMRLTSDLQRSRERLVTAREEERRRLRRELHDGIGPQLAALTLKIETARNKLAHDPAADVLLSDLAERARVAVADVRRSVYALRPPALDQLGLVSALRQTADQYSQNGRRVSVEAPEDFPALPAAVEVAAYRIAQEAMTNVVRHAGASHCTVRFDLDREAAVLRLEVEDDGRGLGASRGTGVGLSSMRERAEELGGACVVESVAGGTRVRSELPCVSEPGE